ncbi:unnamed protein product [Soboliphyme baturini]|uniref:GCF C-terminal domain-containing protein n=1 Tax=Soboliphyme baturini TaxID=241478 RepID=A0A3P8E3Z6_9BILA|nr:unnamed protein product [Soboliphyme baturini]
MYFYLEQIVVEGTTVFADVVEEFSDVRHIAQRFAEWYIRFPKPYVQAFAGLCLPKLLLPFADARDLESFYWFDTLLTYAYCPDDDPHDAEFEPEIYNLIPLVVEKFVCVRVTELMQRVWDPTSSSQTQRLARFLRNLVLDYPCVNVQGKPTQALLTVLHSRLKSSLDEDLFMPIYSKEALENRNTGAAAFLDRQFWFAVKCLKNVFCWQEILSAKALQDLAIDSILNRHLVLGLQCSLISDANILLKAKYICNLLPASWFEGLTGESTIPQLEPMCKALLRIGDGLIAQPSLDRNETREYGKEVCRLLTRLHALKYARLFASENKLKQ